MLSINTNLSSMIAQQSLKKSTDILNQAVERMTTGAKINHASDDAANYAISNNMTVQISSCMVAEDNASMGLDMLTTASDVLADLESKLSRLRDLNTQAENGTYGERSLDAINAECNAIIDEIIRIYSNTEYNGIKLFGEFETANENTTLEQLGIENGAFSIYNKDGFLIDEYTVDKDNTLYDVMDTLNTSGFTATLNDGVLSVESESGRYITGTLVSKLGISVDPHTVVTSSYYESSNTVNEINQSIVEETSLQTVATEHTTYETVTTTATTTQTAGVTTTGSQSLVATVTSSATTDTTMGQLGISASTMIVNYFTDPATSQTATINVNSTTKLSDIAEQLSDYDITMTMNDGVLSLNSASGAYVSGDLATSLGITTTSHTETFASTTTTVTTTQTLKTVSTYSTSAISVNTTFAQMGDDYESRYIIKDINGNACKTITMQATNTLGDFIEALDNNSIRASVSSSSLYFHNGIYQIEDCNRVFRMIVNQTTLDITLTSSSFDIGHPYTSDTKLSDIGITSGELNFWVDANWGASSHSMTVNSSWTLETLAQELSSESHSNVSITYGTTNFSLKIDCCGLRFISSSVSNLPSKLSQTSATPGFWMETDKYKYQYNYYTYTTTETSTSTATISCTATITVGNNTTDGRTFTASIPTTVTNTNMSAFKFKNLGLSENGVVQVVNNGIGSSYTVTQETTIEDLKNYLESKGQTVTVTSGLIEMIGNSNSYISSMSNNLQNALGIQVGEGHSYTTNTVPGAVTTQTISHTTTIYTTNTIATTTTIYTTTTAEETSQISKLKGYTNGNGEIKVHKDDGSYATITVSASDTLSQLFGKLSAYNITGNIENGLITLQSNGNTYLENISGGSNLLSSMNCNNLQKTTKNEYTNGVSRKLTSLKTKSGASQPANGVLKSVSPSGAASSSSGAAATTSTIGNISIYLGQKASNVVEINTILNLSGIDELRNIGKKESMNVDYFSKIDNFLNLLSNKQISIGASQNRLESALEEISIRYENLLSSRSTIKDADIATESSEYIRGQILQQASTTLLATANQSPAVALTLINGMR